MHERHSWAKAEILITTFIVLLFGSIAAINLYRPLPRPTVHMNSAMAMADPSAWVLHRPKLILFGDSLTERAMSMGGWGASLAHTYMRKVDIVTRGA